MKITYLDREQTRKDLQQAILSLARKHPEVERVILFGSLATGQAVPGSDADLLIILACSDLPFLDRIPVYMPDCRIAVDVFPYTREEIERMLASGNWFIKRALAEGLQIYPP